MYVNQIGININIGIRRNIQNFRNSTICVEEKGENTNEKAWDFLVWWQLKLEIISKLKEQSTTSHGEVKASRIKSEDDPREQMIS